jgi:predicted nucleic acid-binding protein
LQGFAGPKARQAILERFTALPVLVPDRADHVEAAELRNECRRRGVQIGTVDALVGQLCLRHELTLLTRDRDFERLAEIKPLDLWRGWVASASELLLPTR